MLISEEIAIRQLCLSKAQDWFEVKMKHLLGEGVEPIGKDVLCLAKTYEDYVLEGKMPSD